MGLTPGSRPWWRGAVGYHVYLRSFADSDDDGLGDLEGLRTHLPHLRDLGVDLVWISPCYPTPDADHGYDVADYRAVDPRFGDLATLDATITEAHAAGLRVLLDLVPNHSSDQHEWFRAAVTDPEAPTRGYYVWRDPAPDGGPPNNWRSHFGGPAWTLEPTSGQYYLHLFLPEQPDLDWRNPAVQAEFAEILACWFERGVDGFRIDVAHAMIVDEAFRDNPLRAGVDPDDVDWSDPRMAFAAYDHRHDLDQPAVPDLYRPLRTVADAHDAVLIGEVYLATAAEVARYVADGRLHAAFYFPALHTSWGPDEIRAVLTDGVRHGRGRFAWPLSSHDDHRAASRFGGGAVGTERALAYFALLSCLPGIPFLYQGDELGLEDAVLAPRDLADPMSVRNDGTSGRDASRSPMPWAPGPSFGFSTARPWIAPGSNRRAADTVAVQRDDPGSPLSRTRRLLAARRTLTTMLATDEVSWLDTPRHLVSLRRGDVVVATNVGGSPTPLELPRTGTVVHTTGRDPVRVSATTVTVPTDTTVLVRLA